MTLVRRINRLEEHHADALHACRACGGINQMSPAFVITRHERPLEQCTDCGLTLDDDGRPMLDYYKRIILPEDAPAEVPRPSGEGYFPKLF